MLKLLHFITLELYVPLVQFIQQRIRYNSKKEINFLFQLCDKAVVKVSLDLCAKSTGLGKKMFCTKTPFFPPQTRLKIVSMSFISKWFQTVVCCFVSHVALLSGLLLLRLRNSAHLHVIKTYLTMFDMHRQNVAVIQMKHANLMYLVLQKCKMPTFSSGG